MYMYIQNYINIYIYGGFCIYHICLVSLRFVFILLQCSQFAFRVCIIGAGDPVTFSEILYKFPLFKFTMERCESSPFPSIHLRGGAVRKFSVFLY